MTPIINPGSGPVDGGSLENAWECVEAFGEDLAERGGARIVSTSREQRDFTSALPDGRYRFRLRLEDLRFVTLDMPGLPVDDVRFMGAEGQNPLAFPRLYVDGSSWLWLFALTIVSGVRSDVEIRWLRAAGVPPQFLD